MELTQKSGGRKNTPKFHWRTAGLYCLFFASGILLASFFWYNYANSEIASIASQIKPIRQGSGSYQFINPLLGYDVPENFKEFNEYKSLESKINALVASESNSGPDAFGFYFRDLSLGRWTGINENAAFAPGSMMKVVLMIAYFKEAETDPTVLHKVLTYSSATADQLNGIPFEAPSDLRVGGSYTVEHLIETMIENSDNGAKNALLDNVDLNSLNEISTDLGFPYLNLSENYSNYQISAKQYSIILRTLYNATYLSREYSEKALGILSQAKYSQGLVAGVPNGIPVAQKFGESIDSSNPQSLEITLSNCGIAYYPGDPYLLCVMTKGKSLDDLTRTIASISHTVWEEVDTYYRNNTKQ